MAFTVTQNFITLYDMESLTGWVGPASLALNTDINRQGTACIGWQADTTGTVVWGPTFATARDLSSVGGIREIWFWVYVLDYLDLQTASNGGIQLWMEDALGNQGWWNVGGHPFTTVNDDMKYKGGWLQTGVRTNAGFIGNTTGVNPDLTQITRIGFAVTKTSVSSLPQDVFIDWCYLDSDIDTPQLGPVVYGPNNTDGEGLSELVEALQAADIGYMEEAGQTIIIRGRVNIGTQDGLNPTRLVSYRRALQSRPAGYLGYPSIICRGALGSETYIQFGEIVGTAPDVRGLDGAYVSGAASWIPFVFNVGDPQVSGGWYGVNGIYLTAWDGGSYNNPNFELRDCRINPINPIYIGNIGAVENCVFYNGNDANFGCIVDEAGNLSNVLKNCEFINNAGALGIEVGGTYTLDNVKFSGNTYDIVNRLGNNITLNCINGSNPDPAKINNVAGGSVTINNVVNVTVHAYEVAYGAGGGTSPVPGATVLLTADAGGPLPFEAAVTISNDGAGTATVTHNAHGFSTGDYVVIKGSNEAEYTGLKQITVVDATTYTYAMPVIPVGSATGTPTSTAVVLTGTTDANGEVLGTHNYASDQPVKGTIRKTTASPLYKISPVSGTITSAGFHADVALVLDE